MLQHRGNQRNVVDVLAGTDTNLALPFWICEILIGETVLLYALFGGIGHTGPRGQANPMALWVAVGGRDVTVNDT